MGDNRVAEVARCKVCAQDVPVTWFGKIDVHSRPVDVVTAVICIGSGDPVSEGVGHSQADRAPSDAAHSGRFHIGGVCVGPDPANWPESSA